MPKFLHVKSFPRPIEVIKQDWQFIITLSIPRHLSLFTIPNNTIIWNCTMICTMNCIVLSMVWVHVLTWHNSKYHSHKMCEVSAPGNQAPVLYWGFSDCQSETAELITGHSTDSNSLMTTLYLKWAAQLSVNFYNHKKGQLFRRKFINWLTKLL